MIDLHVHSNWSDGSASIPELIRMAKETGLSGFALTDHDTTAGLYELGRLGREAGIQVYPGIEISAVESPGGKKVHILGYCLPEESYPAVEKFCRPTRESRDECIRQAVKKLERAGYPVALEQVEAKAGPPGGLYKQFIMQVLMDAGRCAGIYGPLYRELFQIRPNGTPGIASFSSCLPVAKDAVRCITDAGGVAVLAHPGMYGNYGRIPELLDEGLRGIEAFHPKHTAADEVRCRELAERWRLILTGGSDFHGKYGEGERLGQCWVPDGFAFGRLAEERIICGG